MAGVAKWLRQWFVVPPFVGSSPIVRPRMIVAQPDGSLKRQYNEDLIVFIIKNLPLN
jgi:hypothetical protein